MDAIECGRTIEDVGATEVGCDRLVLVAALRTFRISTAAPADVIDSHQSTRHSSLPLLSTLLLAAKRTSNSTIATSLIAHVNSLTAVLLPIETITEHFKQTPFRNT